MMVDNFWNRQGVDHENSYHGRYYWKTLASWPWECLSRQVLLENVSELTVRTTITADIPRKR